MIGVVNPTRRLGGHCRAFCFMEDAAAYAAIQSRVPDCGRRSVTDTRWRVT